MGRNTNRSIQAIAAAGWLRAATTGRMTRGITRRNASQKSRNKADSRSDAHKVHAAKDTMYTCIIEKDAQAGASFQNLDLQKIAEYNRTLRRTPGEAPDLGHTAFFIGRELDPDVMILYQCPPVIARKYSRNNTKQRQNNDAP